MIQSILALATETEISGTTIGIAIAIISLMSGTFVTVVGIAITLGKFIQKIGTHQTQIEEHAGLHVAHATKLEEHGNHIVELQTVTGVRGSPTGRYKPQH